VDCFWAFNPPEGARRQRLQGARGGTQDPGSACKAREAGI
jgi:hypothetical protein